MRQIYYTLIFISIVGFVFNQWWLHVGAISTEKFLSLTLSEKIILDRFRAKVQPILNNKHMQQDSYLIRWLRAKNFNLESAEAMLRENLRWRKENKIDSIQSENWDDMIPDFLVSMDTYDKIGQPIGVLDINLWDIRRIYLQGKGQRHRRFCTSIVENITGQVFERQQKGMQIVQVVALLNADGFNVVQHACPVCIPGWIQFMQTIESYYPEWIDEFIIINAPATAQIVLNAIRPVLSRSTREAVKVFGPNKRKWMDYLDKKISKEERRPQYGGTKPAFKQ